MTLLGPGKSERPGFERRFLLFGTRKARKSKTSQSGDAFFCADAKVRMTKNLKKPKSESWRKDALRELRGFAAQFTLALNAAALADDATERDAFVARAGAAREQIVARMNAMLGAVS